MLPATCECAVKTNRVVCEWSMRLPSWQSHLAAIPVKITACIIVEQIIENRKHIKIEASEDMLCVP
jgi:hypothetical protein